MKHAISMDHHAYLALGANLGDRLRTMVEAAARIARLAESGVGSHSNVYETAPVGGPPGQPDYLNAVVKIETLRSPHDLLAACLAIERDLGRQRSVPNGPRTIDIDILLYDDAVLFSDDLIIPHPRLHTRCFVLQPLADIEPALVHPGLGATVGELLERLPEWERSAVRRVADFGWVAPG